MNGTTSTAPSVIVVGSGPTGLLLAGDLATAGVPVTVLEKRPRRTGNLTRAFAVHARTLEQLDARGLADELEAVGRPMDRLRLFGDLTIEFDSLPTRFRHLLVVPQYEVEKALERRAVAAGARFRHETEVTGLTQDATGVTVEVKTADGRPGTLRAAYVVGADGLRSVVRQAVGLPFPGRSVIRSIVLADVRLDPEHADLMTANAVGDASPSSSPSATATTGSPPGTAAATSRTTPPSTWTRSGRSSAARWAATSGCATPAGCPASTATNARRRPTASGGSSSPGTPRTSTAPPAARA